MINSSSLSFQYNKDRSFSFPKIESAAGDTCLILGPSGCGKTTLLHLLGGLMKPQEGNIVINEHDITQFSDSELDDFRGKNIGIVFQRPHFLRSLSVVNNILAAPFFAGNGLEDLENAKSILHDLGIGDKLNNVPYKLSQGEQQRLSIARVLINNPSVILADEPTSALDDQNCEEVISLLMQKAQSHKAALIIVTHDNRLKSLINHKVILN